MQTDVSTPSPKRELILRAVIPVFGQFGFKKTSMEDLATAATLSKQGLYLHFSSKEELFSAAMHQYLDDGLALVDGALSAKNNSLPDRLLDAMDAWFGRHLATFTPASFDVIEIGNRLSVETNSAFKVAFKSKIESALASDSDFALSRNTCKPKDLAEVLFCFGLTWKEGRQSRTEFRKRMRLCIRACCQLT
jgi:AcrR family transcriptional regulator